MKRMFIEDGSLSDVPEELDIKGDISDGMSYALEDGLYITEDYGDGRVKIDELDTGSGEDVWYEVGVYWEHF